VSLEKTENDWNLREGKNFPCALEQLGTRRKGGEGCYGEAAKKGTGRSEEEESYEKRKHRSFCVLEKRDGLMARRRPSKTEDRKREIPSLRGGFL